MPVIYVSGAVRCFRGRDGYGTLGVVDCCRRNATRSTSPGRRRGSCCAAGLRAGRANASSISGARSAASRFCVAKLLGCDDPASHLRIVSALTPINRPKLACVKRSRLRVRRRAVGEYVTKRCISPRAGVVRRSQPAPPVGECKSLSLSLSHAARARTVREPCANRADRLQPSINDALPAADSNADTLQTLTNTQPTRATNRRARTRGVRPWDFWTGC